MESELLEVVEILEGLIEDLPSKPKHTLIEIISEIKKPMDTERLMKVQDDLDFFVSNSSIDSFTRTEVMNILSFLETLM